MTIVVEPFLPDLVGAQGNAVLFKIHVAGGIEHDPFTVLVGPDFRRGVFGGTASGVVLMTPEREWPIDPAKARRGRDKDLRILGAEEGLAILNSFQNRQGARSISGRLAELLELVVSPIHEKDLAVELVFARSDDLIKPIAAPKLSEFGIFEPVEAKAAAIVVFDKRKHVNSPHGDHVVEELEAGALLERNVLTPLSRKAGGAYQQNKGGQAQNTSVRCHSKGMFLPESGVVERLSNG